MKDGILNIALVGCGGMAAYYRHRYTEIPGVRLALLVDIQAEIAEKAAKELQVENWSIGFKDSLVPEIDMIDISTPNFLHMPQAVAALEAGKHILLQKPIAPNVKDAGRIIEAARTAGVKAGMYMNMLDNPLYYDTKRLVKEGYLGKISSVYCRGAGRGGLNTPPGTWRSSVDKTGGGAFIQKTIHFMNLARWMLEERILRVAAFSKNLMSHNIGGDDVTNAVCEFESGIQGTLESCYNAEPHMVALYGTKGYIIISANTNVNIKLDESFQGEILSYGKPGQAEYQYYDLGITSLNTRYNPYDQHLVFIDAVKQDKPVAVSLEQGVHDLMVVEAVYRAAMERKVIEVDYPVD